MGEAGAAAFRRNLHEDWRTFKKHVPAGAYLPVGQLDGDCKECGGSWPCDAWMAALKSAQGRAIREVNS